MLSTSKLAYYLITIRPTNGKLISAVRELQEESIDHLFNVYQMKANGVYRELDYFNLVLLSRYSQEVIEYEKRKNTREQPRKVESISPWKPKRENKEIGPTLLQRMRASQKPPPAEGTDS